MIGRIANRLRRRLAMNCLAVLLPAMMLFAALSDLGGVDSRSRDISLDAYTQISPFQGDPELAGRMVFVDIDEASLAMYGQWPWPRQYMAARRR